MEKDEIDFLGEMQKKKSIELIKALTDKIKALRVSEEKLVESVEELEESRLKRLKTILDAFLVEFSKKEIPEEVKINKKISYEFKGRATQFLLWSFPVLFLTSVGAIWYGVSAYQYKTPKKQALERKLDSVFEQGEKHGRTQIYNHLPSKSQDFLDNKFPDPDKTFWVYKK